uniref:Tetratricopeptide repeat protein n=1 Tax=Eiseniibacteriota bacterium TaxID=2212470 RepID=A0A832MKN2_UNCEI
MLWTRFLALVVRSTVHTYTITLLVVLVGIVIGSLAAARLADRARHPARWLGLALTLGGLLTLALMRLPPAAWGALHGGVAAYVLLLLPPAVLSGAAFPLGVRLLLDDPTRAGPVVGRATALNTLGGIAGSLAAGFALLPGMGLSASALVVSGLGVLAGAAAWLGFGARAGPGAPAWAAAALAAWAALPWALPTRAPHDFLRAHGELVAVREGLLGNLAVVRDGARLDLYIDGWWQGRDLPTQQVVAAHLPALLHPGPRDVLVVGVGAGQTPSRFLRHPVRRVDCVDIEPAVFDVVRRHFPAAWLDDPRVRLLAEDGRNVVTHEARRYDVIALEVGQVFRPGVPVFYTEDFYRRARARLAPGGLVSQFVSLASLPEHVLPRVVASFARVFPECAMWSNTSEVLLLGFADRPFVVDRARLAAGLAAPGVREDLRFRPWGDSTRALHRPEVLLGGFLLGPRGMRALADGAAPYRDDRPELDHATARLDPRAALEVPLVARVRRHLEPVGAYVVPPLPPDTAATVAAVRDLNLGAMVSAALLRTVPAIAGGGASDAGAARLAEALRACPEDGAAHRAMGEARAARGETAAALAHLSRAVAIDPEDAAARLDLGILLLRLDRPAQALPHAEAAAARLPADVDAHIALGAAYARLGRLAEARGRFAAAVRLRPDHAEARAYLERAEALLRGAR